MSLPNPNHMKKQALLEGGFRKEKVAFRRGGVNLESSRRWVWVERWV